MLKGSGKKWNMYNKLFFGKLKFTLKLACTKEIDYDTFEKEM